MYDINIILSIITANPSNQQQYVLSSDNNQIIFPSFKPINCTNIINEIINNLSSYFTDYKINDYDSKKIFLIDINSDNINYIMHTDGMTINIVYGMVLPHYTTNDRFSWKLFSFHDTSIPNELSIIGETIRYAF